MTLDINLTQSSNPHYDVFSYPAGERQIRLAPKVATAINSGSVGTINVWVQEFWPGWEMELVLLVDTFGDKVFNLFLPYLPYSRADREFTSGDCCGLRAFGIYLDTIGMYSLYTFDVHSNKSLEFVPMLVNLEPTNLIKQSLANFGTPTTTQILYPDKGARDRYGEDFGVPVGYCNKIRDQLTGKLGRFEVPIIDQSISEVLIVDDICDGGGTFIGIADKLRSQGYTGKLGLYVSHGIFSKGLYCLLGEEYNRFNKIYTTNSFSKNKSFKDELIVFDIKKEMQNYDDLS